MKTREGMEGVVADNEKYEDISSARVDDDPMRLTSFGDQESTESLALSECRDDALVDEGAEGPRLHFSPVKIRKSTSVGSLLHAGSASACKAQGVKFPPQPLPWTLAETIEDRNIRTAARQTCSM